MKTRTKDSTWTSPGDAESISAGVRAAMRTLPHPVAIVTACSEESSPTDAPSIAIDPKQDNIELLSPYYQDFCGATVSSLQTVTLGPPTIISFNLKMPSRTLSGLLHHKQFGIHLLKGTNKTKDLADTFVKKPQHEAFREATRKEFWVGLGLGPEQKREDNPEIRVPLIRGKGIYGFMRCELMPDKCVIVGDHMVVIARVASLGVPQTSFYDDCSLSYQHGDYGGKVTPVHNNEKITGAHKPRPASRLRVWQIRKNYLRIHNDALGYSDHINPPPRETLSEELPSIAIGADPLGSLGEEEDGNLMSLNEEGYQNLAKQVEQRRQQDEVEEDSSLEGQEAGSEETISEEIGSVKSPTEPGTGIPPEQGEVLKNSPS
jgi:flavin reductase (DIM6/NTAB) family NADH-FMN oxidoreductase RutF